MHNRRYNNTRQGKGGRGRGRNRGMRGFRPRARMQPEDWEETPRGWGYGQRIGRGPWQDFEEAPRSFGPPPWAARWGQMPEAADILEETGNAFGPPPWSMWRHMWENADISADERRAWLQARKARLQAWKQHLDARLAETEAELAKLDAPEAEEADESAG